MPFLNCIEISVRNGAFAKKRFCGGKGYQKTHTWDWASLPLKLWIWLEDPAVPDKKIATRFLF